MGDPSVVELPRGGLVVHTSAGAIQFGVPPETIKDTMALGGVPEIFVVPDEPFDRQRGINVCEVEFPAYYNFFMLKKRIKLLADARGEDRIRRVLTETMFGPESYDAADAEYDPSIPPIARPKHETECGQFRKHPYEAGSRMEIDSLVEFVRFDQAGTVSLGDVVVEHLGHGEGYRVSDGGTEIAQVPGGVRLPEREEPPEPKASDGFSPPAFGVTVVGSSHGFDPAGKTTGVILWINHRGLLVDPPSGATELLAASGIAPKLIDGVVLTHCHADHDSGAFQKVLEEGRVVLYTTPVVLGSFLRKYSALSGLDEDFLRRTFVFRPVRIGAPVRVHGGELRFFYGLHSIPALGFEAYYGGKSLVFSGDTLYDPPRIREMVEAGTITSQRAQRLLSFPWHHTVVIHEAGVPPLHTPTSVLAALPADVKERLYLIHIAEKDLPADAGLKLAQGGVENTIDIEVEPPRHAEAIELLDMFAGIDMFRGFSLSRAREILQVAQRVHVPPGQKVIEQGTLGDAFYVILSGVATVVQDGESIKRYQAGDFFGETALILRQPRNADVLAHTEVELVRIDRYDFLYLLRGTDIPQRLVRLAQMRKERSWELFGRNSVLQGLTSAQKTQLQSYLEVRQLEPEQVLWEQGKPAEAAYLLDDAQVELTGYACALEPYGAGAFLGEVDSLLEDAPCEGTARVTSGGRAFRVVRADLAQWLQEYPGLHLSFMGTRAVE
jgi:CRP-like cAMP-binding protein/glyoxylase-like metal-dependent hydrolase (beta-lactamase superfamily II)